MRVPLLPLAVARSPIRRRLLPSAVCCAVAALSVPAAAVCAERPALTISRVAEPPVLARYLDGLTVPPGTKVSGFKQREPGDGTDSVVETDVYVSYDDKHLYAVYICRDDPSRVRANLTKRETIMGDDVVGLVLDTYQDGRRAYLFLINPLGIQMDGVATEGQEDDYSFDTLWTSEGRVTRFGYVVVVAVPFKSLRFSNDAVQTWGVAFARLVPHANETSFWPFITRRIAGVGSQLATLAGLDGLSPGRNIRVIPYGDFAADRVLGEQGYETARAGRVGVDVKAVIKDTVTVDGTVNPDFSQVESDEPQVTVNQRFEVFFPEKRPFFIENAGYFETPENLFFSRRVADPKLGGRVTGRAAGWTFGALLVNDDEPRRRVGPGDSRHDKMANIAVVRAQREFAGQSYAGVILTDREWGPEANRVLGADGRWKIGNNWSVTGQGVISSSLQTDGSDLRGGLVTADVRRQGRGFGLSAKYLQVSPDFRTDLGFVRRRDIRKAESEIDYEWHPNTRRILTVDASLDGGAIWDFGGTLQEWTIESGVEAEFPGQTEVGVRHQNTFERFDGQEFRLRSTAAYVSTEWLSWLSVEGRFELGTGVNYYPPPGLAPLLETAMGGEVAVTVKPHSRLRVDQSYLYSTLDTIFTNHILRTRANYQFTRALSLRAIADYEAIRPNASLVDLEHEKRFGVDVLVTYLVNPWTAVYAGYTDNYENWVLASPSKRPMARSAGALTAVGRQAFVKLSYLFTF